MTGQIHDRPLLDEGQVGLLRAALGRDGLVALASGLPDAVIEKYRVIKAAFAAGNLDEGRRAAVGLAGVASNFGAARLAMMLQKIARETVSADDMTRHDPALSKTIDSTLIALELQLGDALGQDEFEVWYQPWIHIESGEVLGYEALLRWNHPIRGLMGPQEFVSIAEESSLVERLGGWLFRRVLEDAMRWPSHIQLAVNLFTSQSTASELSELVRSALSHSGFDARRLELEIADLVANADLARLGAALLELRALGVKVVLDHFGGPRPSLRYLQRFPCDRIKIDGSLIGDVATNARSAGMVAALVALGVDIETAVTAQGVETSEQLAFLRSVGCREAQGALVGRPRSGAEIQAEFAA